MPDQTPEQGEGVDPYDSRADTSLVGSQPNKEASCDDCGDDVQAAEASVIGTTRLGSATDAATSGTPSTIPNNLRPLAEDDLRHYMSATSRMRERAEAAESLLTAERQRREEVERERDRLREAATELCEALEATRIINMRYGKKTIEGAWKRLRAALAQPNEVEG